MEPLIVGALIVASWLTCVAVEIGGRMLWTWWQDARRARRTRIMERDTIARLPEKLNPNPGLAAKRGLYLAGSDADIVAQLTRSDHRGSRA